MYKIIGKNYCYNMGKGCYKKLTSYHRTTKLIQSILKSIQKNHKIIFISHKKMLKCLIDYRIIDFTDQNVSVCFLGVLVQKKGNSD